jgi:hypothetical protein
MNTLSQCVHSIVSLKLHVLVVPLMWYAQYFSTPSFTLSARAVLALVLRLKL